MRRQRHDVEYPPTDASALTPEDVREDLPKSSEIVALAARVLYQMAPF